ncbi:type I restriction endonuclease subunit R [Streptococcaceae bacterium ESL0729]|nr:type I restriction endonuclease subunit R [Streptococcaceae bacterium ESL0729]
MYFTEDKYENAMIELFEQHLGYDYLHGPDIERDYREPYYLADLISSLERINASLPQDAINEALSKITRLGLGSLIEKNKLVTDWIQNGVEVSYFDGNEERYSLVKLVDYENIDLNSFKVINQWTVIENSEKRPDIIVFLNGLPLVVFELKSPSRTSTDFYDAYLQLKTYQKEIPGLFSYNAFSVTTDLATSKAGTITANEDRYMEWKTIDGSYENTQHAQWDTLVEGIFDKKRFLNILKNFICFSGDTKILAAYHQYYAVNKAVVSTEHAAETEGKDRGKGGVFWHTQGSGKSLSMVFYTHELQEVMGSPTVVVITDRNDLDNQLFSQFSKCKDFLRQEPIQAGSREHLKNLLSDRKANGIIFTTMQKFEELDEPLSERRNIVVMADEAHRGQYGLREKVDAKTGKITVGTARIIRDQLPNATYIGFTGTPISAKDKSTTEVFGDYIDIYDMTQAVEDRATRPVFYESRVIHLNLDDNILRKIDDEYALMADEAEEYAIERSKRELGRLESILGADQTVDALVKDIIDHYENFRENELTGKAMVVAYSRPIAMKIYKRMLELRPSWKEKIGVVMTSNNNDPENWHEIVGNKHHKNEMARKFKDNEDPFKIAIVVDMWLTGFDVPSLATMYVYKPMKGHNLMQAIARVNRVYGEKVGGLVVDYIGIAGALKEAMNDYTKRDKGNFGDPDIAKTALPRFKEKLECCRELLCGYDYSGMFAASTTDLARSRLISGGTNFLLAPQRQDEKERFIREATLLRQAASLCSSLLRPEERYELAYFEAVRTLLTRITGADKPLSFREINERINNLIEASIHTKGVINLFSTADSDFSLFDSKFLEEVSKMKEKNIAVEILKKLLVEQIRIYQRINLVQSEKFSDKLSRAMNTYINGLLTNEEVIKELMDMAKDMVKLSREANELNLTPEEQAFYDALTQPKAVKDFYNNDQLLNMVHELTDMLRKNRTIDWQLKESTRAGMRRMIKRLLRKYKYPPEEQVEALKTVLRQAEMWADAGEGSYSDEEISNNYLFAAEENGYYSTVE